MNLIERIGRRQAPLERPRPSLSTLRWERGGLTRDELAFYAGEYRHAVVALADAGSDRRRRRTRRRGDSSRPPSGTISPPRSKPHSTARRQTGNPGMHHRLASEGLRRSTKQSCTPSAVEPSPDVIHDEAHRPGRALRLQQRSKSTQYFELHAERDHEHAAARPRYYAAHIRKTPIALYAAAEQALKGNWKLLDGVNAH